MEEEDEEDSVEEQEDEEEEETWEKALSVERFGDIISDSASTSGDRMGRHYTEKDFECKQSCWRVVYKAHVHIICDDAVHVLLKWIKMTVRKILVSISCMVKPENIFI